MIWSNGKVSYNNQLEKLPTLKSLVESKVQKIQNDQSEFEKEILSHNIPAENFSMNEEMNDEWNVT